MCFPDPPSGAAVTCSGVDDNGFTAPPAGDLAVDVASGAALRTIPGNPNGASVAFDGNTGDKLLQNQGCSTAPSPPSATPATSR